MVSVIDFKMAMYSGTMALRLSMPRDTTSLVTSRRAKFSFLRGQVGGAGDAEHLRRFTQDEVAPGAAAGRP